MIEFNKDVFANQSLFLTHHADLLYSSGRSTYTCKKVIKGDTISMSSVSFDSVAHLYDATRGFPEPVIQQIVAAIEKTTNANTQTRFLEVGVGTGRFAFPLAEAEHQYTGIDISEKMLSLLEEKLHAGGWQERSLAWGSLPDEDATRKLAAQHFVQKGKQGTMRLAIADMTAIPFYDASFDAVIAIHVFHLVPDWQKALQEVVRVLRPGGVLVRCWNENWNEDWKPDSHNIKTQWCTIVQELGGNTEHPGTSEQTVTEWLQQQGCKTEQVEALTWQRPTTARAIFEEIAQRAWTSTLLVPDTIFPASLERLWQWIEEQYGDSVDEEFTQEKRVIISRTLI
jgi:ubiquinone/menaquinone biosynthesis C-methylase UbiE